MDCGAAKTSCTWTDVRHVWQFCDTKSSWERDWRTPRGYLLADEGQYYRLGEWAVWVQGYPKDYGSLQLRSASNQRNSRRAQAKHQINPEKQKRKPCYLKMLRLHSLLETRICSPRSNSFREVNTQKNYSKFSQRELAFDPFGCRVLQKILEKIPIHKSEPILV